MTKLNDRLIRLPEVCKILGISLAEAKRDRVEGNFLAPRTHKQNLRGEPTPLWLERRVRAWADSWVHELQTLEPIRACEPSFPAWVSKVVDAQEYEESKARIALSKSRWS